MPSFSNLRTIRRDSGITYADMAQRTGLPVRLLAEIEHGMRLPQADHVQAIAQALGIGAASPGLAAGAV